MRLRTFLLVGLVVLPMGFVAARAISIVAEESLNPCFHWSDEANGYDIQHVRPGDPCSGGTTWTSETKAQAVITALLVPGGILAAAALALYGAGTSRAGALVIAACIMFVEAIPTCFSVAPISILTGAALMITARKMHLRTRPRVRSGTEEVLGIQARLRHLFLDQKFFLSE